MAGKTKRIQALLLAALSLIALLSGCVASAGTSQASSVQAASQVEQAMQLVATSAAICEILDRLEYDDVIGVPETEREIPVRYQNATTIGAPMSPDLEIVKSLSPSLVLSPSSLEGSLAQEYTVAGINSAFLDLSSVQGMYGAVNSLGALLGREAQAAALQQEYQDYLAGYEAVQGQAKSILLLMAFPDGFYLVATEKSYVGNLVELAGGENVYANYNGDEYGFVNINPEDMVQREPDLILVFAHYSEEAAFAYMQQEFASNETWQYYDAVQNGQVYYLPSDYFGMSATLSSWMGALEYLQPVLYAEQADAQA